MVLATDLEKEKKKKKTETHTPMVLATDLEEESLIMANPDAPHRPPHRQHRRSKNRPSSFANRPPPHFARVPLRQLQPQSPVEFSSTRHCSFLFSLRTCSKQLGIPHAWASIIWLCGPLSGLLVQPLVGHLY